MTHPSSSPLVDHRELSITGYTDRLSARPGESVTVHASSTHPTGSLRLVRLSHDGTSFTKEPVTAPRAIELAHREVALDSHGIIDSVDLPAAPFTLRSWVWVSLLPTDEATLLAINGLVLTIDATGTVVFSAGDCKVRSKTKLQLRRWYRVAGGLDAERRPFLVVQPQPSKIHEVQPERVSSDVSIAWKPQSGELVLGRGLNGKLEDITVGRSEADDATGNILRLDFARGISTWLLHDDKGAPVGRVVGLPARAVRGRRWDGSLHDWRHAPDQYAAIHFHTDSQGDQRWPVTATIELPDDLPGGVYAVELSAGSDVDHLPLIVRRKGGAPAPALVLLPTLSYVAYSCEHHPDEGILAMGWTLRCPELAMRFSRANNYHSLYDTHIDGSPVALASIRRPLLGIRPDHRARVAGCEHQFSADLHLIGWLARQGFEFDVITDHDLDVEGVDVLLPYRAVLTGHHPEYTSGRMHDAIESYLVAGGNLAYLGGNGFCWAVTLDPNDPSIVELRRGPRQLQLEGDVGEEHFQLTGAPAGLWNTCGRMQATLVGVTWTCTGMEDGKPYQRTAASFDPRVADLFAGIGADEPIGEKGAFLGAGASFEVDLANPQLGTPEHTLVLATALMPEKYMTAPLPILKAIGSEDESNKRRADMTYFETGGGGAVFSASSMGWVGALSHDGDRNAASRLMANVVRSFTSRPRRERADR